MLQMRGFSTKCLYIQNGKLLADSRTAAGRPGGRRQAGRQVGAALLLGTQIEIKTNSGPIPVLCGLRAGRSTGKNHCNFP